MRRFVWMCALLTACAGTEDDGAGAAGADAKGDTSFAWGKDTGAGPGGGGQDAVARADVADAGGGAADSGDLDAAGDAGGGSVDVATDVGVDAADGAASPCEGAADGTPCDLDADLCSIDVCAAGVCAPTGVQEDCASEQAEQPCWTFTCSQKSGCVAAVFVVGNSCNDGNPCTTGDTCQELEFKTCLGTPVPVDDGNPCTDDACAGGQVTHVPIDGMPCTIGADAGVCQAGTCQTEGCAPVDGGFTDWTYGACDKPCGGGTQSGTRSCAAPAPACGGAACDGPTTTEQACNLQACPTETVVLACPAELPFPEDTPCVVPQSTAPFGKVVSTGGKGDSYGVSVVRGPGAALSALYHQQEWLERIDESGNLVLPAVRLATLNSSLEPSALGEPAWPAFYGPALATNGTVLAVVRPSITTDRLWFYTVDGDGLLVTGPTAIDPPGDAGPANRGPSVAWAGTAWVAAWEVDAGGDRLLLARVGADGQVDASFGTGGVMTVAEGGDLSKPRIAVDDAGTIAGLVWGEGTWGAAVVDLTAGKVLVRTEPGCSSGMGTNDDGHDIVWNQALGEFGVLLTGQGTGLCDKLPMNVTAAVARLSPAGAWLGAPTPVLCGYTIGAGHRGAIAARPEGRYGVAMARYHTKPYCVPGFNNGTQGKAVLEVATLEPVSGVVQVSHVVEDIPSVYAQVDLVWGGTRFVAMCPVLFPGNGAGWTLD